MKRIDTEILIIGGGATGTSIAWDASLRGFQVILVEKRDLTHGTTGRFHGLLHSGGRYVVKDPGSATECIEENRILRRTYAHCIEDTSGFFVVTPEDEGDYPEKFKAGCAATGVPCTEISIAEALRREPLLNPRSVRVFELPDGSADSFLATHATAQAARLAGAKILVYHEVIDLVTEGVDRDRRMLGAKVRNVTTGEEMEIRAQLTINATGAWSGRLGAMAGITINVIPGKGTMVAMNHRLNNTVLNRCKKPSDGDIIVPIHTVAVIGTTDERVTDPENLRIEPWEVQLMLSEGERLIPGISHARVVRAWAGVRPLYQESYTGSSREATRAFTLLRHNERDGMTGFLSILGGKWTTFRLMAEKVVDAATEQVGIRKPCITATTVVPGVEQGTYWLGHRLHEVEHNKLQADLVCECELVTRAMIENAARRNPLVTLDDLRRDVRLGMGPCQGGFCTYRATGILHEMGVQTAPANADAYELQVSTEGSAWEVAYLQSPAHNSNGHDQPAPRVRMSGEQANLLLRDFLQERWKGLVPILWGQQLKQERLDELIYLSLMNADHLPVGNKQSPLTTFFQTDTTPNENLEKPHG